MLKTDSTCSMERSKPHHQNCTYSAKGTPDQLFALIQNWHSLEQG
jgi:hypothetical protein